MKQATARIDVQFHYSPAFYTAMVAATGRHITTDRWSVAAAHAYMDRHAVATGILSVSTPGVDFLDGPGSVTLARRLNEAAARIADDEPGRFGNFATLPMQDVDATLREIEYCFDTLGMDGVCMMSNTRSRYPGDPAFDAIFDELDRRGAVIFIHPTDPACPDPLGNGPHVVDWLFDTTRAAINLVYSGTMRRCRRLRVILAHAGGTIPIVHRRIVEMAPVMSQVVPPITPDEATRQIAAFHYDLAISAHPNSLGALRAMTTLDQVLFACDWPFAPDAAVAANVGGFEALVLSASERFAIERGNAERLFPRLRGA